MVKLPILYAGAGMCLALWSCAGASEPNESISKGDAAVKTNPVLPVANGSVYSFQFGDTQFSVDASRGGRIVTFALSGRNILTGPTVDPANYGSTFWSSPQSVWNWPPPPEIDSAAYTAKVDGAVLSLSGTAAAAVSVAGLAVEKQFSVDADAGVVTIVYTIANRGTQAHSVAPWEITRVAAGGLTFFPMGPGGSRQGPMALLNPTVVNGVAWIPYNAATITSDQKLFADGLEGWIAHVDGDLLLVKSFGDTSLAQAAPGEAEIEVYANADHTYVEVENQGAYGRLAPGASINWTVRWILRKLDLAATPASAGSAALLDLVRSLVK